MPQVNQRSKSDFKREDQESSTTSKIEKEWLQENNFVPTEFEPKFCLIFLLIYKLTFLLL